MEKLAVAEDYFYNNTELLLVLWGPTGDCLRNILVLFKNVYGVVNFLLHI